MDKESIKENNLFLSRPIVTPRSQTQRRSIDARREELVDLVRQRGFISIDAMAAHFKVSSQTIRRDIDQLCQMNKLARHHGGAGLLPGSEQLAYANRKTRNLTQKNIIASLVAKQIPNGSSLFIDIGTTMEAVAKALIHHKDLRIITNHIRVVSILSESTDFEIILAGGLVRNRDQAITGEATSEFLRKFKVGYAIFGIGSIENDGAMLDYDYRDVHVSKTAIDISKKRFAAADHSKFNTDAMVHLGHVSAIDAFFTDTSPPLEITDILTANNVDLFMPATGREN
jgi:DeoR family transcriptional regulator, glycerol-3-phosphate regulon repressor